MARPPTRVADGDSEDAERRHLSPAGHDPVLLRETLEWLDPRPGQSVVDCTLGRSGHASAIAPLLGPDGLLIGTDVDPRNLEFARDRLREAPCRVRLFHANFAELPDVLAEAGIEHVDGVLADLGLSTNQLFDPHYGLSFAQPMPLDMRIDPRLTRTAADLVNMMRESELADVLYELAQERYSRRISKLIAASRRISPINTTDRLAELVRSAIPRTKTGGARRGGAPEKIDPATRTFLALRMAVNREVENLAALLERAPRALRPPSGGTDSGATDPAKAESRGGRLAVISFQSTEDRMVKQAFRSAEQAGLLKVLTRKPLSPAADELAANPRSRSAKLRVAEKKLVLRSDR
jgi:16S rRNA (cytosine1402-N4)-methyltransferase